MSTDLSHLDAEKAFKEALRLAVIAPTYEQSRRATNLAEAIAAKHLDKSQVQRLLKELEIELDRA